MVVVSCQGKSKHECCVSLLVFPYVKTEFPLSVFFSKGFLAPLNIKTTLIIMEDRKYKL